MAEANAGVLDCMCGCGAVTKGGNYLPGHDQKLRSAIEKEVGGLQNLRQIAEKHIGRPIKVGRD